MWTYHAERLVPGEPSAVRTAIAELVHATWGDRSRTVLDARDERIDAIAPSVRSTEADVWLTWRIEPRSCGTWVVLHLDELERGPDPSGELSALLDRLAIRVHQPPAGTGP